MAENAQWEVWRKVGPTGRFEGLSHAIDGSIQPDGMMAGSSVCGVDICKDGWEYDRDVRCLDDITCQRCRGVLAGEEKGYGSNSR